MTENLTITGVVVGFLLGWIIAIVIENWPVTGYGPPERKNYNPPPKKRKGSVPKMVDPPPPPERRKSGLPKYEGPLPPKSYMLMERNGLYLTIEMHVLNIKEKDFRVVATSENKEALEALCQWLKKTNNQNKEK